MQLEFMAVIAVFDLVLLGMGGALLKYIVSIERRLTIIETKLSV